MKRLLLAILLLLLGGGTAEATCSSVPFTFVPGTLAQSGQVNANFAALVACINVPPVFPSIATGSILGNTSGFTQAAAALATVPEGYAVKQAIFQGTSAFQGTPCAGWTDTENQTYFPTGGIVSRTVCLQIAGQTTAAKNPSGGGTLAYPVGDDGYVNYVGPNLWTWTSTNTLRNPATSTTNVLDAFGLEFSWARQVPNPAVSSGMSGFTFSGNSSDIFGILPGSGQIATANTSNVLTVTLANHNLAVGNYVTFPNATSGGGISLGGSSDTCSTNGNFGGAYFVQSTPTVNTFTIDACQTATSNTTIGGSNYPIDFPQIGITESTNPFAFTMGSATVNVTHASHEVCPATGTNTANPLCSTSNPTVVFWSGASASNGCTLAGNHTVQSIVDANTYAITINPIQDGCTTPSGSGSGGGTPTASYGATAQTVNYGSMSISTNAPTFENPCGVITWAVGSPPSLGAGSLPAMLLDCTGLHAVGLTPNWISSDQAQYAQFAFYGGLILGHASLDSILDLSEASGQNSILRFTSGGQGFAHRKFQVQMDSSLNFAIFDVAGGANQFFVDHSNHQLTLGIEGQVSLPSTVKDVMLAQGTALPTNSTSGFVYISTMAGAPVSAPANWSSGYIPIVIDTTDHKLCWNETGGSTWKCATGS